MASTSKIRNSAEDEVEQEIERFDDFTLASSWERFISEIEAVCRRWLSDGPKNLLEKGAVLEGLSKKLYKAKSEFKYSAKNYFMEYYFEAKHTGKGKIWESTLHDIQLSFGVNEFLVIAPQSASGVVLDSPEASKLLSAVAIALSNCSSHWPAFVPVHDPSRKAYIGIQNMGTIFTRRFEADQIGSQVPVKLMHLEGLYELFVSKFAFSADFSLHLFKVQFTMKLTYRTLPDNEEDDYMQEADDEGTESSVDMGAEPHHRKQWDDDCPWSEWYSAENPVKGYELIAIWSEKTIERSLEMAEVENSSPHEAETWLLLPTFSEILSDDSKSSVVGFASQLSLLVKALEMSFEAQFLEDFVSVESGSDNLKASAAIPPPSVVDRVLKDLFQEGPKMPDFAKGEHKCSRAIKGAPLESLFAQFCLHSLWFGNCNIRAIAMLWIEFIREVRWCWEESQLLPKMLPEGVIDLSTCLINQKLQMLAICIEKKREANQVFYDATEDKDALDHSDMEEDEVKEKSIYEKASSAGSHKKKDRPDKLHDSVATNDKANKVMMSTDPADRLRRGSVGVVGSMMLLNSSQKMHAPFTQEAPLMTEDMHEERIRAIEAFGDSINFSAQLEREVLLSDMSAFKAANPDAIFEDFIRWHSPGDWENDVTNESQSLRTKPDDDWPPRGHLSKRMSDQGNFWRQLWNDAPAIPASDQKLLLDPNREGEKSALLSAVYLENGRPVGSFTVLHYLETLRPHQLLEQMVCTAFRASADTLNQTTYGDFNQLKTRLEQLYRTLASGLRPLQANRLSHDTENFKDLSRLSVVFKNVEKFVHLAASLHRKFIRVPRLSKAILSDYCNFYLLGSSREFSKEFDLRQQVRLEERHIVVDMFPPPTANQSWRKVLSMGNLLNGHEPIIREIIFSMRDTVSGNHYSACGPSGLHDEIETYRMYISGSSNDLQVALSVVSCD